MRLLPALSGFHQGRSLPASSTFNLSTECRRDTMRESRYSTRLISSIVCQCIWTPFGNERHAARRPFWSLGFPIGLAQPKCHFRKARGSANVKQKPKTRRKEEIWANTGVTQETRQNEILMASQNSSIPPPRPGYMEMPILGHWTHLRCPRGFPNGSARKGSPPRWSSSDKQGMRSTREPSRSGAISNLLESRPEESDTLYTRYICSALLSIQLVSIFHSSHPI